MKPKDAFDNIRDVKAERRDVKRTKKTQPTDNRNAVRLISRLSVRPAKKK